MKVLACCMLLSVATSIRAAENADLSIGIAGPSIVHRADWRLYTLALNNAGPSDAINISFAITVASGVVIKVYNGDGLTVASVPATCSPTRGQRVVCSHTLLRSNSTVQFTAVVESHSLPTQQLTTGSIAVSVSSFVLDPNVKNNSASLVFTIYNPQAPAPAFTQLYLWSADGDFVGNGHNYYYDNAHGDIFVFSTSAAPLDTINIIFYKQPQTAFWILSFSSHEMQVPLAPGMYAGADRWPYEADSHPGLNIAGSGFSGTAGNGCNRLTGWFNITALDVDETYDPPLIRRFSVEFVQHCEFPQAPPLHGVFEYAAARRRAVAP